MQQIKNKTTGKIVEVIEIRFNYDNIELETSDGVFKYDNLTTFKEKWDLYDAKLNKPVLNEKDKKAIKAWLDSFEDDGEITQLSFLSRRAERGHCYKTTVYAYFKGYPREASTMDLHTKHQIANQGDYRDWTLEELGV